MIIFPSIYHLFGSSHPIHIDHFVYLSKSLISRNFTPKLIDYFLISFRMLSHPSYPCHKQVAQTLNPMCNVCYNNSIDVYVLDRKGTSGRHALIDRSEYWRDPRDGLRRWISEGRSLFLPPHEIWPFNMLGRYLCTRGIAPDVGIRRDRDRFRRQ